LTSFGHSGILSEFLKGDEMIHASKFLKEYIEQHGSNEVVAKRWGVSRQTVHNVAHDGNIGADLIASIIVDTGFDFEKAFVVMPEPERRKEDK
jgi:hypothetical protein